MRGFSHAGVGDKSRKLASAGPAMPPPTINTLGERMLAVCAKWRRAFTRWMLHGMSCEGCGGRLMRRTSAGTHIDGMPW